jgi:hypothetical protein
VCYNNGRSIKGLGLTRPTNLKKVIGDGYKKKASRRASCAWLHAHFHPGQEMRHRTLFHLRLREILL